MTSAAVHAAVLAGLILLAQVGPSPTPPPEYRPITFVMMAPPPPPPIAPTEPLSLPPAPVLERPKLERPAPVELARPETPPPAPKPIARSEPAPAPPEPPRPMPVPVFNAPAPAPSRTPPPPVKVGLFTDTAPTVHEAEPAKNVRSTGFDAPSPTGKTGDTKSAPAVVGAFDSAASGPPAKTSRSGSVVTSAGFGSTVADAPANRKPAAEVRPSGFDAVTPAPAPQRAVPAPDRVDVPVEILFKPTPVYTEEARTLKLEGEVLLDVEFAATGTVSVLKVVRGLGHGLDEAATAAAKQIRFKPAQSAGHPINFRTTVHIVFRLA